MPSYERPATVPEAVRRLASGPWSVLAGGTDLFAAHVGRAIAEPVLDVSALPLGGVASDTDGWRIGAGTTWSELLRAPLPPAFDGLKAAAREIGGPHTPPPGTSGGTVGTAAPAPDGGPPLLALDAVVLLASLCGDRRVPLADFIVAPRRTVRRTDELVVGVFVPRRGRRARSAFLKLGARRHLVISIAMVAATLDVSESGLVSHAGVAVGSCSARACRLPALERKLVGASATGLADRVDARDLAPLSPIDDVRASADYRRDAALTLVRRVLRAVEAERVVEGAAT